MTKDYDYYNDIAERMWIDGKKKVTKDNDIIQLFSDMPKNIEQNQKLINSSFGSLLITPIE